MAAESIITYLKPNFPKKGVNGGSYSTQLEYIGPYGTLLAASPAIGAAWGDYEGTADTVSIEPISGTSPLKGELVVTMVRNFEAGSSGGTPGTSKEITYEVEWTAVQRPLAEHPEFRSTGTYPLDATALEGIAVWENDKTAENRALLSSSAEKYAQGIDLGIRTYDDFAPILIKTTSYVNGPPSTSDAGSKDTAPAGFPNLPSGYEWVKSADRSLKSGRRNKWERSEQWTGAIKVLVDKNELYY
jgi:hypothetical protein